MTRDEKLRIKAAKWKWLKNEHPTFNDNEIGSFAYYDKTDTTANGLTSCIIDFLKYEGWQAERISVQGQAKARYKVDPYSGKRMGEAIGVEWIKGSMTKGSADISATIKGMSIKIEVKMKDKQSDVQKKYQADVERAGGKYWLVHSLTEFFKEYDLFTLIMVPTN
jgi:hypothetical protein